MRPNGIRKMRSDEEGEGIARTAGRHIDVESVLTVRAVDGFHLCGGFAGGALIPDGGIDGAGFEIFSENRSLREGARSEQKQG